MSEVNARIGNMIPEIKEKEKIDFRTPSKERDIRITELKVFEGWTLNELADLCGITSNRVNQIVTKNYYKVLVMGNEPVNDGLPPVDKKTTRPILKMNKKEFGNALFCSPASGVKSTIEDFVIAENEGIKLAEFLGRDKWTYYVVEGQGIGWTWFVTASIDGDCTLRVDPILIQRMKTKRTIREIVGYLVSYYDGGPVYQHQSRELDPIFAIKALFDSMGTREDLSETMEEVDFLRKTGKLN